MTNRIQREIEQARQKLLDLGGRNRLINFRPTKRRTIKVVEESPREIYDILVLKNRSMSFRAAEKQAELLREVDEVPGFTEDESSKVWVLPPPDAKIPRHHRDTQLDTSLEASELQRRLFYIYQQSRSFLEEQGYTTLYLALGFLRWKERPEDDEYRRAPLILVPVDLERTGTRKPFILKWTEEDISTNISLQAKLNDQHGISLPEFDMPEEKEGIDKYFESVQRKIRSQAEWDVIEDIYLSSFSFAKFLMYKYLDPANWPDDRSLANHPLLREIFSRDPSMPDHLPGFDPESADETPIRNTYHVLDADSSQIAVIEDIKAGRNIVVQGPPGTGKSQTIANTIGELMAQGKKVLFVSEKMAALEVVKSRLDQAGLGDFCLELHSRKTSRKNFIERLKKVFEYHTPPESRSWEQEFRRLERLRESLNGYAKALRIKIGEVECTVFDLHGMHEKAVRHFERSGFEFPRVDIEKPELVTEDNLFEAKEELRVLANMLDIVDKPLSNNPWRGCEPGTILPGQEEELTKLIGDCRGSLQNLKGRIDKLIELTGLHEPDTKEALLQSIEASKVMADSMPIDSRILLSDYWDQPSEMTRIMGKVKEFQSRKAEMLETFKESALDKNNIDSILTEYKPFAEKFFRWFYAQYRRLKKEISELYISTPPKDPKVVISDLEKLAECLKCRENVKSYKSTGERYFGSYWDGEESDQKALEKFSRWVILYRNWLLEGVLTKDSANLVEGGIFPDKVNEAVAEIRQSVSDFEGKSGELIDRLGANLKTIFGSGFDKIPFTGLESQLDKWEKGLSKLREWAPFAVTRKKCLETIAKPLIDEVDNDVLGHEDLVPCLEGNFADALLRIALERHEELGGFLAEGHEKNIRSFRKIDREFIENTRKRLVCEIYSKQQSFTRSPSAGSDVGILHAEFRKRRRHKSIRKIMIEAGEVIQDRMPCFMMSPISVAQFIPPESYLEFDVVIFDEASQVKPEDALVPIVCGKQVAVVGDSRQLPPTTFFDSVIEGSEEEDEETTVRDFESILDVCSLSFPDKQLNWHYRSKHESLIAVSNQEFYDNRLYIYPSAFDPSDQLGLHFIHLEDTVYVPGTGAGGGNRKEARAVAEHAIKHYQTFPDKSLGIGTFNVRQQEAIQEEMELQLNENPEMEELFRKDREEHFFVKNIETIQGDERDVIFISVGFGFDVNGKIHKRFGPIIQEGGHRRLNVLWTRAKEKCVVFANFRADDLNVGHDSSRGLKSFKIFLDFAEKKKLRSIEISEGPTESPFEDSVLEFLKDRGFEVRTQVGVAGYPIDLGIIDPSQPGRYILGIECDGVMYHSSRVARDRDRLRQEILKDRGWRLHRIWSTDWYQDRTKSREKLLEAIEKTKGPNNGNPNRRKKKSKPKETRRKRPDPIKGEITKYKKCDFLPSLEIAKDNIKRFPKQSRNLKMESYFSNDIKDLERAVVRVVKVEGPVHDDIVIRRVSSYLGISKVTERVRNVLGDAIKSALQKKEVTRRGARNFLWPLEDSPIKVRDRDDASLRRIEWICKEEIAEAIKLLLKSQGSTPREEIVKEAPKLLGFKAVSKKTATRVKSVTRTLLDGGKIEVKQNGRIGWA